MTPAPNPATPGGFDLSAISLAVVDAIPAMVAYWDEDEVCRFANRAYLDWFGRTREEMIGITLEQLLGPIYPLNRPYIRAALAGETQHFERTIPIPGSGEVRESIATYIPETIEGRTVGFYVHVSDATLLKRREQELERTVAERDQALAEVRTLRGLLKVCAACKSIRDDDGRWVQMETYVSEHTDALFSHGLCPSCARSLYPELG